MPHPLNKTTWLDSSVEASWKHQECHLSSKQLPTPLLSNLSSLFVNTVAYLNLTKQEALNTIGYFLHEQDDLVHAQLLDCFINNQLLNPIKDSIHLGINQQYKFNLSGVFIPLTKCYSPSCQSSHITCYSPLCPNKRVSSPLRMTNQHSFKETLNEEKVFCNGYTNAQQKIPKDWIESIPHHIRDSTNRKELKRQAGIAELLLTEQNYCHDLDILDQVYAIPLLESTEIISHPSRRQRFHNNVFGNYLDIAHLHHAFYDKLTCHNRQSSFFVGRIGSLIMQHATSLVEPYIQYVSNHIKAIHCMTIEHKHNAHFARFLEAQNAKKCTRRLGLVHYLTSPTFWIGKFKLIVEAILKNTIDDADQLSLKASLAILHDTLCRMNCSTFNVSPQDLRFEELLISIYVQSHQHSNELQLLALPKHSKLIREEVLWLARSSHPLLPMLCHMFLFSHALVLTHPRVMNEITEYIVIQCIPIRFLAIDSNTTTSMIRRLSFASTFMVSTPLYLINTLRQQKSINSEGSAQEGRETINRRSYSWYPPNRNDKLLAKIKHKPDPAMRKTQIFQVKTKFLKLKNRWSTGALSVPSSPTHVEVPVLRRDSAPALLFRSGSKKTKPEGTSSQQQRRTLKICHLAYPDNTFKLEFNARSDRLVWETMIRDIIVNLDKQHKAFNKKMICKSLPVQHDTSNGNAIERTKCACAFVYDQHEYLVAIGTQTGIWIGSRNGSSAFELVLPNRDVRQLAVIDDKLIALIQDNKDQFLIAYSLHSLRQCFLHQQQDIDSYVIKQSNIISFAVGKIRNQPVIMYLTRRLKSTWLVVVVPTVEDAASKSWYKKFGSEYKVTVKNPTELHIIADAVFVRSEQYGIERIDVLCEPSLFLHSAANWVYIGANIALIPLSQHYHHYGIVCDGQCVYTVALFQKLSTKQLTPKIKFESQVNYVAFINHYLIGFSSTVIEIRSIDKYELIQVIKGNRIKFISSTNDPRQALFFSMTNSKNPHMTSIYQLQISI